MSGASDVRGDGRVGGPAFDPWPAAEVHVEWGPEGAAQAAARGDVVVVVDVLSFSTTVALAVERGATALVHSGEELAAMGGRAAAEARLGAELIARDRAATTGRFSLSPASLRAIGPGDRVIFTSLNGARCLAAASRAPAVLVGCLRNMTATADAAAATVAAAASAAAAARRRGDGPRRCTVVACGERWTSVADTTDSLRPGIEDLLGAGAIAAALAERGLAPSPEAELAALAHGAVAGRLADVIAGSVSGRELVAGGYAEDVRLATEVDTTATNATWLPASDPDRHVRHVPHVRHRPA